MKTPPEAVLPGLIFDPIFLDFSCFRLYNTFQNMGAATG